MSSLYVSIGHPARKEPMIHAAVIPDNIDILAATKKLRKEVAENAGHYGFRDTQGNAIVFKPSELYWAIFESLEDEKPTLCSDNYGTGVPKGENPDPNFWYEKGYMDAKNDTVINFPAIEVNREHYKRGGRDYLKSIRNLALAQLTAE
jgi:hypothetical protein